VFVALLVMLLPAMEAPYGLWGKYDVSASLYDSSLLISN
jgi:hypothetical protein